MSTDECRVNLQEENIEIATATEKRISKTDASGEDQPQEPQNGIDITVFFC